MLRKATLLFTQGLHGSLVSMRRSPTIESKVAYYQAEGPILPYTFFKRNSGEGKKQQPALGNRTINILVRDLLANSAGYPGQLTIIAESS